MIYFDSAATTFQKPKEVSHAVYHTMNHYGANAGRGGHRLSVRAGELIYETREELCKLFDLQEPEQLVFCQNTTQALNVGIKGILREGDHVVISSMEHNSVLRPIEAASGNGKITYSIVRANEKGELSLVALAREIRPNTRLILITHASNVCGNLYDIEAVARLAHDHGILCMIDAAQSAGVVPIRAEKFDLVAFPGHKGLLGPQGTGGLYVRKGLPMATIMEGGTGSQSESYHQPTEFPDRLESGTQNVAAIAGLGEGVRFLLREGLDAVRQKEAELTELFTNEVLNIPNVCLYGTDKREEKLGVVALNIEGMDCVELASILDEEYGICVRAGLHCAVLAHETLGTKDIGCVRFSFGYFNTKKEIERACYALSNIASKRSSY
ncbi:MAG: aminotransferase class V-fold PLP-dependent enzyme [Clostridia bacterium]|nr:aminotransferase class V-fold PLP-dependent enzyme [Clostridia bacterium]MBQ3553280.1 aminotransferase class V-fold PLP-dependent enzyme [Clostridia bacterium]